MRHTIETNLMSKAFSETRIETIRRIAREALVARTLSVSTFADEFVVLAQELAPIAWAESHMRTPHPTDGAQYEKDRYHNRQIVDRWLKGAVHEFPVEFEEPWVMALPKEARDRALHALSDRYGLLPARQLRADEGLASFSEVLSNAARVTNAMAPIVADGKIDESDRPYLKAALESVLALTASLASMQQQLVAALPDASGADIVSLRSVG